MDKNRINVVIITDNQKKRDWAFEAAKSVFASKLGKFTDKAYKVGGCNEFEFENGTIHCSTPEFWIYLETSLGLNGCELLMVDCDLDAECIHKNITTSASIWKNSSIPVVWI